MSNLLINEPPLMVLPTLASKIGLNEAIVLQQIHYWLDPRGNKNIRDGRHWVYNSYKNWEKQFPFWSIPTLRRTIKNLEASGVVISKEFKKNQGDKTKWYTINYNKLASFENLTTPCDQNDQMGVIKMTKPCDQNDQIYNKEAETTTDKISSLNPSSVDVDQSQTKRRREKESLEKKGFSQNLDQKTLLSEDSFRPILLEKDSFISFESSENLEKGFPKAPSDVQTLPEDKQTAAQMFQFWNESVGQGREPVTLTPSRLKDLEITLQNSFSENMEEWKAYCLKIASSKFLMGETAHVFQISLDWAIKPKTVEDITGGKYTLGTRENPSPSMIPVDTETKTAIEKAEETLIESILSGRQNIPFREVFIKRIQFGFEGIECKRVLETYGWERGGFSRLLEDYINDITFRATKYDSGKTLEEERVSW